MQDAMKARAKALLADGTVARVIGWRAGDFDYDITPASFATPGEIDRDFVYNDFCGANLSKYMVALSRKDGKTLVFLKPCDTYSFNQLLAEHRIKRDAVHAIGVPCSGKVDPEAVRKTGLAGITGMTSDGTSVKVESLYGATTIARDEVLAERCRNCKSRKHVVYDELLGDEGDVLDSGRFDMVAKIEAMDPDERFAFWRGELSRCVRCNSCRNVCPACTCEKCVFDNDASGVAAKAASDPFEENMFHVIRAFHVAGRCTDCGECSRVCPEHIPLHLLNRKVIKDIDEIYGGYQAGAAADLRAPLATFDAKDAEPSVVYARDGGKK